MATLDEQLAAAHRELEQQEQLFQRCLVQLAEAQRAADQARHEAAEANQRWQSRLAEAGSSFQQADLRLRKQQEELGQLQRELVRMAHESELRGAELTRAQARMEQLEERLLQAEQVMSGDAPEPRLDSEQGAAPTARIAELQALVMALETEQAQREARIAELEGERSGQEQRLAGLQAQRDGLEARCAKHERELMDQRAERDLELAALRAQIEAERSDRELAVGGLEARCAERDREVAELRARREQLEAESAERGRELDELRTRCDGLAARCAEHDREEAAAIRPRAPGPRARVAPRKEPPAPHATAATAATAPLQLAGRLFDRAADLFMPVGSRRRAVLQRFRFGRRG